jgi:general secretion pathway protein J
MTAMSTPRASKALRPASAIPNAPGNGFTLIELLVALFIAALMFAMGYGAINQALQNRGSIRRHQQNLVQLETTMRVIEQDFVQLAPRPVRDAVGDTYVPCLQGGPMGGALGSADTANATDTPDDSDNSSGSTPLVVLTRGGWSNPTGLQRSELERVAYVFDNGTLVREHWNVLDPTLSSLPIKRNLLKHLRSVTFRYMSTQRSWLDTWPPAGVSGQNVQDSAYRMRPLAVQVTLDTKEWGKITRIFEIAQ